MGHRKTLFHFDRTAIPQLTVKQVSTNPFILPPPPEQRAIAAFLDEETTKLDALVAKVETAIERLQEYRSGLITAAVTGKIDVREEVEA
jgi:restriction endonuclease S subunit